MNKLVHVGQREAKLS